MQSIKPQEIFSSPKIVIFKKIIDKKIANEIIKEFSTKINPSLVTDCNEIKRSEFRTSSSAIIKKESKKLFYLREKTCSLLGWNIKESERFQFIAYNKGQEYVPHFDAFDLEQIRSSQSKVTTQRMVTNIIYLNENFSGGETFFPKLNLSIKAELGMMLSFENCISNTDFLNPFTIHQSNPIKQGKKYVLVSWLVKELSNT